MYRVQAKQLGMDEFERLEAEGKNAHLPGSVLLIPGNLYVVLASVLAATIGLFIIKLKNTKPDEL